MSTNAELIELHHKIVKCFNVSEFIQLCFELDVDHELLNGQNKGDRSRELIGHMQRRDRLPELVLACQRLRPNETWPDVTALPSEPTTPNAEALPDPIPFFVGGRINDRCYFFGRERLVREIRADLRKYSSVSIIGEPQIGKSSLLYYLYATRQEWLPTEITLEYIDLQGVLDEADFCETVIGKLGGSGDTLRHLKRTLYQRNVILLFDEVERIAEPDFNPRLHDLLRSLAQEPHFAMCLVTQRPLTAVFPPQTPGGVSPFHNIFTSRELGPFTKTEACLFLQQTEANFNQAEIEHLLAESHCLPARLQRLAKRLLQQRQK